MITVRLAGGTTVHAFGAHSVLAKTSLGVPDAYWQRVAEASVAHEGGDLYAGLMALPGAQVIRDLQGFR